MPGCPSMNRSAEEHIQAVDQIMDELINRKISFNVTSMQLRDLGYNFDERWAMINEAMPNSKVVKLK
jgi:hypothetical protein